MPGKIFSEFMEFLPKGLNPFKIQIRLKLDLLLNFIIQNPEGFGSSAKNESCPFYHTTFGNLCNSRSTSFIILKVPII
jgi:hypothetical protein